MRTTVIAAAGLLAGLLAPVATGPAVQAYPLVAAAPTTRAATPADEPTVPEPRYQSISRDVLIEMSDGVRLAATVALPSRDGVTRLPGRLPTVVGITPYGRDGVCSCYAPDWWASRGFVGAVVDTRGTGGSGGDLEENYFSPRESRDGATVVDWLGSRPWSNGKVGMAGGSYVGITQLLAAGRRPEHLAAIAPQVALADLYRDAYTHGGVPSIFFDAQYVAVQGVPGALTPNRDPALLEQTLRAKLGQSPVGTPAFDFLARPEDGRFYRERSPITVADRIEVPTLLIGSWRDGLSQRGAPELYRVLSRRPGVETRLVMGPCTHKGCGAPFAPLTDPADQPDPAAAMFEFMRRHLAGERTPDRPAVQYYLQGAEEMRSSATWPPAGVRYAEFDLAAGSLRPARSTTVAPGEATFVTNPAAGLSMALDQYGTVAASPYVPTDQRLEGPNGLTFRTGVLDRAMTLAGPIALHLEAASTATDTDFHAKLADVAPDGSETLVTAGALRASHRAVDPERSTWARPWHPHTQPVPIEPGRYYDYAIELWPTAYRVAPGHRLQLRITSSDLPTHFPGRFLVDRDDPTSIAVEVQQPSVTTVRFGRSTLVLPLV